MVVRGLAAPTCCYGIAMTTIREVAGRLDAASAPNDIRLAARDALAVLDPCMRPGLATAASCAAGYLHEILDGSSEDVHADVRAALEELDAASVAEGEYSEDELLAREVAEAANLDAFVRLLGDGGLDDAPGHVHRGIE